MAAAAAIIFSFKLQSEILKMKLKQLAFLLLAAICMAGCEKKGDDFTVIADIADMPSQQVILEELSSSGSLVLVDSTTSDDKGHFELSASAREASIYKLNFSDGRSILLSIDKGTVKLASDWKTVQEYKISGSAAAESFRGFMSTFRGYVNDINMYNTVKDSMAARGNDSMLQMATAEQKAKIDELTRFIESYADTTKSASNALFAVQWLDPAAEGDYLAAFMGGIERRFPGSKRVKDYVKKYDEMMEQQQSRPAGPAIGTAAPDITLTSTDGKQVSVSSYKGKYLLIDFWASWCGPCRRENPNVVAAYEQFKSKNFDILGISLDEDRTRWMEAIEKDKLTWTHISDLKGWESTASRTYGVESIPTNFLVDPEGKIIARDLRGEDLHSKLAEVLK
jgi:peroxiredoxin